MHLHICKTEQETIAALAEFWVETVQKAIAERGVCNVALSGGRSPQRLHALLASAAFRQRIEWEKINFFFGDERDVPGDDPNNNAWMARQAMLDRLQIPNTQIFSVPTTLPPAAAARAYDEMIARHFQDQPARFDLILLGLGDNAHTASLFPHTPVLTEASASVQAVYLEEQQVYRITMTAPLINQARQIAFLVFGIDKAPAVQQVIQGQPEVEKYPAQLIRPATGALHWFLDEAAAARLTGTDAGSN